MSNVIAKHQKRMAKDWRRNKKLLTLAWEEFEPLLETGFPRSAVSKSIHGGLMNLVQSGTAVVNGQLVPAGWPPSIEEAGARMLDLIKYWMTHFLPLYLEDHYGDTAGSTVFVPKDGNFQRHAQGVVHLLKERPDLMKAGG